MFNIIFSNMEKIYLLVDDVNIRIWRFTAGIIETNTYIIAGARNNCFFIDMAAYFEEEFDSIKAFLKQNGLFPAFILNTHGHFDHISGADRLRNDYNIPLIIAEEDNEMLTDRELNRSLMLSLDIKTRKADINIMNEKVIYAGDFDIEVIKTPGHTKGSLSFLLNGRFLFSGDTLFKGAIGRCFSLNDLTMEKKSIKEKLLVLNENTLVFPGHGDVTTIGEEKEYNKYLKL